MKAVNAEKLSKKYIKGKKAVENISFSLEQGEVYGFLGPNGAGKTTTVKLLNGMLSSTGGSCSVFGLDPGRDPVAVHRIAGVVTEHAQMYDNLTGIQNLVFYGSVFGVGSRESEAYGKKLLQDLELTDAMDRKLATYSTGMRQRLSLARAMIHRPKVLFLDEPTSGLDPESAQNVNGIIKNLAKDEGVTIFLCTHQLRYAQEICTTYGLIDDGMLLATGRLDELRSLVFSGMTVNIAADHFPDNIVYKKIGQREMEIKVQSEGEIPQIVRRIVENGGNVYGVSAHRMSLEEIYFSLLEKRKNKKEA